MKMLYDVFVCHAYEDKESFVRPLAEALQKENLEVWYDEFSLKLGDSIRQSIDRGLRQSRFGVVVLSKSFFEKNWPQYELDGLAEREMAGRDKVILPIWHDVMHDEVMGYSPSLAGRKAVLSSMGMDKIVSEIITVIHPNGSPLIIARDIMLEWGLTPPVITDQYWLNVVEASNRLPGFGGGIPDTSIWNRWSFPLPSKKSGPKQWGERLAWSAMQLDWVETAESRPITPLTPPAEVLAFVEGHPGLLETCQAYPELAAEYAPQVTIPNMGGKLESCFEEEYEKSLVAHLAMRQEDSIQGSGLTINRKCPLCDVQWAFRHPSFGDYKPDSITQAYFFADLTFGPNVSPYDDADHAFWLLSDDSLWLPKNIHAVLLEGMLTRPCWKPWGGFHSSDDRGGPWKSNGALWKALSDAREGKGFKWTSTLTDDVHNRIERTIGILGLPDSPEDILDRFLKNGFCEKYIQAEKKKERRRAYGRKTPQRQKK
jgi:hypothetical protein